MRYSALVFIALGTLTACAAILGDDFEVKEDAAGGGGTGTGTTSIGGQPDGGDPGGAPSTGGMMTGGGGNPGVESCTNGADDDSDGFTDCEDTDCTDFSCIPEIPASWTGPIAQAVLPWNDPKPACPATHPNERHNGVIDVIGDPVTCNGCSCPATNPTCIPDAIEHYSASNCPNGQAFANNNPIGGCDQVGALSGQISVRIGLPSASVTCIPQGGGIASTPPVRWTTAERSCHYDGELGEGCATAEVCAPRHTVGMFGAGVCILKSGDEICPAPFLNKTLWSDSENDVVDTRNCTNCGCAQQSASCNLSTRFYNNSTCAGTITFTVANNNTCQNFNINGLYAQAVVTGGPSGSCSVTQNATAQGTVTAVGPYTTICCM